MRKLRRGSYVDTKLNDIIYIEVVHIIQRAREHYTTGEEDRWTRRRSYSPLVLVVETWKKRCATCALTGESTSLTSHCDAIVRVEAQMPDLSTFPALLNMQQSKVSRLVI